MNTFYTRMIAMLWCGLQLFTANAQTDPSPQSLPYVQNFAGLSSVSTIYPAGWQGWSIPTGTATVFQTAAPTGDFALTAPSNASITSDGIHNYNGAIGFLATGTTSAFTSNPALCLSINTTGRNNILLSYTMMTIRNPFVSSTNNRINQVDLQYRIGTSGSFTSVGTSAALYQNNTINQTGAVTTPQNSQSKSFNLPAACNNQPVVQLRWVQRDLSGTVGSSRPSFAVDNVVICASTLTPSVSISGPTAFCTGSAATYTATAVNGGTSPFFQWKINGINVATGSIVNLTGLNIGDEISCVMTSNASCVTTLAANSNSISIGTVNSSPVIGDATIINASCPGAANGSIDISVSGGTPPYTICWDTANSANGPVFGVIVGLKTAGFPFPGGIGLSYYVDGVDGKELILTKGIQYSFSISAPGHPWHISTDSVGANTANFVLDGQSGPTTGTQSGTVTFVPNALHQQTLYYPCAFHQWMGGRIRIRDGYCVEDPGGLHAGIYSVIVSDANGCTATAQYTVGEDPSPITLSATVTDAFCGGPSGSIDLEIFGGAEPYTVCWDTINTENGPEFGVVVGNKTPSNPYFGIGNTVAYYIDGIEAKELDLIRGISYSFNVFSLGHPWHISTDSIGGSSGGLVTTGQSGAPQDNGIVTFRPDNSHPSLLRYDCSVHQYMGYNINMLEGYCLEDPQNLRPGIYSVTITDATGCYTNSTFSVGEIPLEINAGINSIADASCFGFADGSLDLEPSDGQSPYFVSGTGPVFSIISLPKNHSHPQFGIGSGNGYEVDGIQGKELTLIRGITYSFSLLVPGHPFFISTSIVGGPSNLASEVTQGVVNSMITSGTLFFTPDNTHPSLLYYQCAAHNNMGWKINIVDQLPDGDLSNCMAGSYSLFLYDANGCVSGSSIDFDINEPGPNTFYYDGDNDLFGVGSESALACNPPPGFTFQPGDCNDGNPSINPGATEICNNGVDENCNFQVDEGCSVSLGLKIFFEGYYLGSGMMQPVLLFQNVSGAVGTETDTALVELRSTADPSIIVSSSKTLVLTDGTGTAVFNGAGPGTYWIAVKHRNSIQTWSAAPVTLPGTYDFTSAITQAYLSNMVDAFGEGIFSFYSGDINQDEFVDIFDFPDFDADNQNFVSASYVATDLNGDGFVDIFDFPPFDANNQAFIMSMHP